MNPFTGEIPINLGEEIDLAFANVAYTLQQAGGKGWEQVYKVRWYSPPLGIEARWHIVRNLRKYCSSSQPVLDPVGVQALAYGLRIEIEVAADLNQ